MQRCAAYAGIAMTELHGYRQPNDSVPWLCAFGKKKKKKKKKTGRKGPNFYYSKKWDGVIPTRCAKVTIVQENKIRAAEPYIRE